MTGTLNQHPLAGMGKCPVNQRQGPTGPRGRQNAVPADLVIIGQQTVERTIAVEENAFIGAQHPVLKPLAQRLLQGLEDGIDRKSTRLNSSHVATSYALFCLKHEN